MQIRRMKADVAVERMVLLMGMIVLCLLALYVFYRTAISPGLESSGEAQAKVMANTIAISINTLSRMDAGRVERSFSFKQPMTVEVYNSGDVSYLKVTYENKPYEIPLLVNIDPIPPLSASSIRVEKDEGGKVYLKGDLLNLPAGSSTSTHIPVRCKEQPPPQDIGKQISIAYTAATQKYPKLSGMAKWDENLIKAVIMKESSFIHCKSDGTYTTSEKGAIGFMQLKEDAASEVNVNRKNPLENINGGTEYLAKYASLYGSVELGLAAYNCGPGCVKNRLKFGTWATAASNYPKETQQYVPLVLAYRECYSKACSGCNCSPQGACLLC